MFIRRVALAAAAIVALAVPAGAQGVYDLSPQQPGRPRTQPNPAAVAAIAKDAKLVEPGVLTVATNASTPPLATYATDSATLVGADPDVAQLIADSLGLKLKLIPTPWADWPLGVASGKYDAAISNIGVTEQPLPLVPREIMNNEMYIKSIRVHQQAVFALTVDIFNSMDEAFKASLLTLISHDFPFSRLPEVFDFMDKDRTACKVMIHFGE